LPFQPLQRVLAYTALLLLVLQLLTACSKPASDAPAPQVQRFLPPVPPNLGAEVPYPDHNPFTQAGVALGRMLFYDPILSGNNQVSCASCHQPDKAFADGKALSTAGVSGRPLQRNTPALINLAWMEGLFWDGGAKNLESLVFGPLTHPDEMGQNLKELTSELQRHATYPRLFRQAFGSDSITSANIARALAQFQRTLISANSRYDKHVRGESGEKLTLSELQGMALFRRHCAACHATDSFTDQAYHNNGLDSVFSTAAEGLAYGRGRITRRQQDVGKYKTPTLRNVALTAPYMHDGRFATLDQVLEHYRSGVMKSATLDAALKQADGQPGIPISSAEKEKIILFLNTLTDQAFLHNKAWSNPF